MKNEDALCQSAEGVFLRGRIRRTFDFICKIKRTEGDSGAVLPRQGKGAAACFLCIGTGEGGDSVLRKDRCKGFGVQSARRRRRHAEHRFKAVRRKQRGKRQLRMLIAQHAADADDRRFEIGADGALQLGGICLVAGLGGATRRDGSLAYYFSEPIVENDAKGVGPLLLAYTEILAAQKQ